MKKPDPRTARHPFFEGAPPEYPGLEKGVATLLADMGELKQLVAEAMMAASLRTFTAKELAQRFGVSYQHLRNNPWTLPNYGRPDIGRNPGQWLFRTALDWYAIPEDERRRRWEAMSSRERRVAMGIVGDDGRKTPLHEGDKDDKEDGDE
jgi:hypothetical protein